VRATQNRKKGQDLGQEVDKDGMKGKVPSTKVRAERFTTPTPTPPPPPSKSEESFVAPAAIPPVPPPGLESVPSPEDTGRAMVACPGGMGKKRMEVAKEEQQQEVPTKVGSPDGHHTAPDDLPGSLTGSDKDAELVEQPCGGAASLKLTYLMTDPASQDLHDPLQDMIDLNADSLMLIDVSQDSTVVVDPPEEQIGQMAPEAMVKMLGRGQDEPGKDVFLRGDDQSGKFMLEAMGKFLSAVQDHMSVE
jgi:hypothetical protein